MSSSSTAAELINSVADLVSSILWPVVIFSLFLLFKKEIIALIRRIKKGKVFGHEFELAEEVDRFATTVQNAQEDIYIPNTLEANVKEESGNVEKYESDIERIISVSSENAEFGLILLAKKIEAEMKRLMALGGHLKGKRAVTFPAMAEYLGRNAAVSENLRKSIQIFGMYVTG